MIEIIDTVDMAQHRELAWARHLMGEITDEASEMHQRVEAGECKEWMLWHALDRHILKMNMICDMLKRADDALIKALEMAKEVQPDVLWCTGTV